MKKRQTKIAQGFSPEELNRPIMYHYHSFVKLRHILNDNIPVPCKSIDINNFIFNHGCSDRARKERDLAIARISTYDDNFTMENPNKIQYKKSDILEEIRGNGQYSKWFILSELNTVYEILNQVRDLQQGNI